MTNPPSTAPPTPFGRAVTCALHGAFSAIVYAVFLSIIQALHAWGHATDRIPCAFSTHVLWWGPGLFLVLGFLAGQAVWIRAQWRAS